MQCEAGDGSGRPTNSRGRQQRIIGAAQQEHQASLPPYQTLAYKKLAEEAMCWDRLVPS